MHRAGFPGSTNAVRPHEVIIMSTSFVVPTGSTGVQTRTDSGLPQIDGIASAPSVPAITGDETSLFSTVEAAQVVAGKSGQFVIVSAKKNNSKSTGAQDGWQAHIVVPSFAADIASLGEWAELVNSALLSQASATLKEFRTNNPMAGSIPLYMFTAQQLRQDYLAGGDAGSMTREELERAFCESATWKRISGSDNFKNNATYRMVADRFKAQIVSLAGRSHGALTDSDLNKILAKLEEADLGTRFGSYVFRRIGKILQDRAAGDVDSLDVDAL